ncbi:hypothetical protein CYY_008872 [Polysphondylium violaceum]|uniref:DNA ligase n=1 Tax=Polysphondylium violaceum TaxID=133409 RepID=A0A8J4V0X8_9MYCE|nr:hypothetical protein CYY_008872 [Polysphondylium violaceum]
MATLSLHYSDDEGDDNDYSLVIKPKPTNNNQSSNSSHKPKQQIQPQPPKQQLKNNNNSKSSTSTRSNQNNDKYKTAFSLDYDDQDNIDQGDSNNNNDYLNDYKDNNINISDKDFIDFSDYKNSNSNSNSNKNIKSDEQDDEQDDEKDQQQQQQLKPIYINNYDYQKTVPFKAFCDLLDKVTTDTKHTVKKKHLSVFFNHFKEADQNYFQLIRLLLPHLDKERQTYGLKEKTLAKFYVEILNIANNSIDASRLINYRKPISNDIGGDFGTAVYLSLRNRCITKGCLSMADINLSLDQLNSTFDRKEKVRILKRILRFSTAQEQKWYVRIILKDLKTGLSEKSVLNFYHPDAMSHFNISSNLRTVCENLKPLIGTNQTGAANSGGRSIYDIEIKLFQPLKPMLANRQPINSVFSIMEGGQVVVETKYDGERIQIHRDGDTIKYFSRNSNDSTYIYGNMFNSVVKECVIPEKCIIDGELLVWDSIAQKFEDFGKLKTLALGGNGDSGDPLGANFGKQLCFIAFDVIYVKDQSVMELPLSQRYFLLKRCVNQKAKSFEISEHKPCSSTADLVNYLDVAIMNRDEGIMVKNLNTCYVPGERKDKWIKIKPEYIDGVGDDLDLVIIGGYYGSGVGRRGGTISHFLLGVPFIPDDIDFEDFNQNQSSTNNIQFFSFCKVGAGYTDQELQGLQKLLEPHWREYKTSNAPKLIQLAEPFKERPDVWIDPKVSVVLQIKAAQIVPSEKYRVGYTLRFPRVVKIRDDKSWGDALDFDGAIVMAQEFEGRYAKRKFEQSLESANNAAAKKKSKKAATTKKKGNTLLSIFQDTDTSNVIPIQTIFQGLEFCVVKGDTEYPKSRLEIMIVECGGSKVQYPSSRTNYVIASKEVVKVQNIISSGTIDVIHFKWIVDCYNESRLISLGPKYMIFTTEATKKEFLKDIDIYGDSYTLETTKEMLKDSFDQIDKQNNRSTTTNKSPPPQLFIKSNQDKFNLEKKYFLNQSWWGLFRGLVFYLDKYQVIGEESTILESNRFEIISNLIRFYGGDIDCKFIKNNITHVVIDNNDLSRLSFIKDTVFRQKYNIEIIEIDWILTCIEKKQIVHSINYEIIDDGDDQHELSLSKIN